MQHLSANDVNVVMDGFKVNFEQVNLSITDNTTATKQNGRPNGFVIGDVEADGYVEIDSANLDIIAAVARGAGSFQDMEPVDISFIAAIPSKRLVVDAFGCKLKVEDLLDATNNSNDKLKHKIAFSVTDEDFIHIDGVPYASSRNF